MNFEFISFLFILSCEYQFMRINSWSSTKRSFGSSVSVDMLARAKRFALRRRVWFRALSRVERGIIDLTLGYVICIRSTRLAKVVAAIIEKLQMSLEGFAEHLVRTVGLNLARKISELAIGWGNRLAARWASDRSFARFLAFNFENSSC
jgi:hypothetical protein